MGFADKLVRFVRGEPLYQPGDVSAEERQQNAITTPGSAPEQVVPLVAFINVVSKVTANGVEVRADVQNESDETLQLQRLDLLGRALNLQLIIMPKEVKRYVMVYSGNAITSSYVGNAVLSYRISTQDLLYSAIYEPEVRMVDQSRLGIFDFKLQLPVNKL